MKKVIIFIIIIVVVFFVSLDIYGYFYIKSDVKNKVEEIKNGQAIWTDAANSEVNSDLREIIDNSQNDMPIVSKEIMKCSDVKTDNGVPILFWDTVTFTISSISYSEYLSYCEANGITDAGAMASGVSQYADTAETTKYKVKIKYIWESFEWSADYRNENLADAATGGLLTYYSDYKKTLDKDMNDIVKEALTDE